MPEARDGLPPLERAVSDTLDEYLVRMHGITTSHTHPREFLTWLRDNGHEVVPAGELERLRGEVARLRAGEADTPGEPGAELTPSEWIRRWNDATPEERLKVAAAGRANAQAAYRCFRLDHEGRLAHAEEAARQAQDAIARVRRLCELTINASIRVQAIDQARDTLAALDGPEAQRALLNTLREQQAGGRDAAAVRHRVADAGEVFALRAQARQIAGDLRAVTRPGDTITLDFADVAAVTNCFADELLAGLTDRHVVISNANEYVREELETVRARRGLPPATNTEETNHHA